jgi:hypothetical protein
MKKHLHILAAIANNFNGITAIEVENIFDVVGSYDTTIKLIELHKRAPKQTLDSLLELYLHGFINFK